MTRKEMITACVDDQIKTERDAIVKAIIDRYGEITNRGCNINGKWLSIQEIIEIIKGV